MYIYMNDCCFSVVKDKDTTGALLVRARRLRDFQRLNERLNGTGLKVSVKVTPNYDYQYRATIERSYFNDIMVEILYQIDYSDFKQSIDNPEYHHLMHEIHALTRIRLTTP